MFLCLLPDVWSENKELGVIWCAASHHFSLLQKYKFQFHHAASSTTFQQVFHGAVFVALSLRHLEIILDWSEFVFFLISCVLCSDWLFLCQLSCCPRPSSSAPAKEETRPLLHPFPPASKGSGLSSASVSAQLFALNYRIQTTVTNQSITVNKAHGYFTKHRRLYWLEIKTFYSRTQQQLNASPDAF